MLGSRAQIVGFVNKYRDRDKQQLLRELRPLLEPDSWDSLSHHSAVVGGPWSGQVHPL